MGAGPTLDKVSALDAAVLEARQNFLPLQRNGANRAFQNDGEPHRFSTLDDVLSAVMPALVTAEITVTSALWMLDGKPFVVTALTHKDGGYRQSLFPVADVTPHKVGGAMTYGQRYGLSALLGLQCEDDDDGNGAQGIKPKEQKGKPSSRPSENKGGAWL